MSNQRHIVEFEWDSGNLDKSYKKHGITPQESEEVFLDENFQAVPADDDSANEKRFIGIGQTSEGKSLFVVFTLREQKIRIISARHASRKERRLYAEKVKKDSAL